MATNNRDVNLRIRAKDETGPGVKSAQTALERLAAAQKRTQARRDLYAGAVQSARDLQQAYISAAEATAILGRRLSEAKRPSAQLKAAFATAREEARKAKADFLAAGTAVAQMQGKASSGRGSFAAFENGIASRAGAEQAARGVNALGDAIAKVAANDARLRRMAAYESFQRVKAQSAETRTAVNSLGDALQQIAAAQQRKARFAAFDQIATGARKAEAEVRDLGRQIDATNRKGAAGRRGGGGGLADRITDAYSSRQGRGPLGLRPYELQNLGYQVNDLFTQIGSGTPVMQAFAQQGGQIAQIFPKATSAILRFSPAIAAALLVASPFIVALKQMSDEATRLEGVDKALATSGNAADYSRTQLAQYAETLQDLGVKAEDVGGVLRTTLREGLRPEYFDRVATAAKGLSKVTGDDLKTSLEEVTTAFTGNADEILALDDKLGFLSRSERKHIEQLRESKKDAEARTEAFAIFERKYGSIASQMEGPWSRILDNFSDAWGAFGKFLLSGIQWDGVKQQLSDILNLIAQITDRMPGVNQNSRAWLSGEHARLDSEIRKQQGIIASGRGDIPQGSPFLGGNDAYRVIANLERQRDNVNRRIAALDRASGRNQAAPDTTFDPPKPANTDNGRDRAAERALERQRDFVESLKEANEQRAFELSLIDETEREARILSEIEKARNGARDVGLTLTEAQAQAIRDSVGALYDGQKAQEAQQKIEQARLDLAQQRGQVESEAAFVQRRLAADMEGATAQQKADYAAILKQVYTIEASKRRQAALDKASADYGNLFSTIQQQMDFARENGDAGAYEALRIQLEEVRQKYLEALQARLAFWQSQENGPEAQAEIANLQHQIAVVRQVGQTAVVTGEQIANMAAGGATNAIDDFFSRLEDGQRVFAALRDSFLQFAADFLRQIAQMIAMQAILNALGYGGSAPGAGSTTGVAGWINGLFRHSGGLVGTGGGFRPVNPAVFANATRYHSGGLAGLAPDEVPAILTRNEEVLTEDDPRHRNNGGLAGRGPASVKITNVFDTGDILSKGLDSETGAQSFWNFVRSNSGQFKAILG